MANPPQPLQLRPQDAQGMSMGGLQALNTFLRQVQQALAGHLTFVKNHVASIKTLDVTTFPLWSSPSYQNSWADFGGMTARYTKLQSGLVVLEGGIAGGTLSATAFTLPAGYRPGQQLNLAQEDNGAFGRLRIDASGNVTPLGASNAFFGLNAVFVASDLSPTCCINPQVTFEHGFPTPCTGLVPLSLREKTEGSPVFIPAATPDWQDNGDGTVTVRNFAGLAPSKTYTVSLLCLGEPTP